MTKYEWESELKRNIHRLPQSEIKRVLEYYTELFMDKAERGYTEQSIIAEFGNPIDVADKILYDYNFDRDVKSGKTENVEPASTAPYYSQERDGRNDPRNGARNNMQNSGMGNQNSNTHNSGMGNQYSNMQNNGRSDMRQQSSPVGMSEGNMVSGKRSGKVSGGRLAVFIVLAVLLGGVFIGVAVSLWAVVVSIAAAGGASIISGIALLVPSVVQNFGHNYVMIVQLGLCIAAVGVGILLILLTVKLAKLGAFLTKKSFSGMKNFLIVKKDNAYNA